MKARIAIVLLVAFTLFITWRAKLLEKSVLGPRALALVHKPAPQFQLTSLDGRTVSLADYRSKKKLVVSFWASWCGPCRMELPMLRKFYEDNRKNADQFEIVAISIDENQQAAQSFVTKAKLSFPVLLDSDHKTADAYLVDGIPVLYIIDKDGTVSYGHEGLEPNLGFTLYYQLGLKKKGTVDVTSVGDVTIDVKRDDSTPHKEPDAQPGH
jgi:thiol-disulfide isomerase/thioredoxin